DQPAVLERYLPAEVADKVRALHISSVYLESEPRRLHPEGNLASQILGFVGTDFTGLAGLEKSLEVQLGGQKGELKVEVDTAGEEIALGLRSYVPPVAGADTVTTIDRFAQQLVEDKLDEAMEQHSAESGTIIVLEPKTGAILAMASRPSFGVDDPDLFAPEKQTLYRCPAISDVYEPGSVFKVVTMSSGIDAGAVAPDETYYDEGYVQEGNVIIHNAQGVGYGWQTMAQILQRSLNTGSSYVARKLGPERFYAYVQAFGFGAPTGVALPGEAAGLVRTNQADGWSASDLLTNSFGQGIAVTPLQMARAVSVIANDGRLVTPQIVREVRSPGGDIEVAPEVVRQVISPEAAHAVTDMMVNAVDKSVVGLATIEGYRVAGKSGTAEILVDGKYVPEDTVASFIGFAPADEPRFLVLVAITRSKDNIWGEAVAAPIFQDIMEELLRHAGIGPQVATR
ncbi:MAG: peptidoglycan D,D-transpeptidase FtsI family protein, partial [Chloroflexota bacterium]